MKKLLLYFGVMAASIALIMISFQVGYFKGMAAVHSDPFRLIRGQSHSPYPTIDELLKKKS